jgi:hypothetical protein
VTSSNDPCAPLHERELENLRTMFIAGSKIAAPAGMYYCAKRRWPPPYWLVAASSLVMFELLTGKNKKRGRATGIIQSYRRDMIDYDRWSAVVEIKDKRVELAQSIRDLGQIHGLKAERLRKERERLLEWAGTSNLDAFDCALIFLDGTPSEGRPDTIKRSYEIVERNSKDPVQAKRYCQLDADFLHAVGIPPVGLVNQGKIIEHFLNLAA